MNSESAAVYLAPSELNPWEGNPRVNDHVVDKVMHSIQRFNFGAPILARREDLMVIAGHTRLKAALKLGLERVPVRLLDLTISEAKALALADNKLSEEAQWSAGVDDVLRDLDMEEINLEGLGWSDDELAQILEENEAPDTTFEESETDYDQLPEEVEAITEPGEVVKLGNHTLYCGDCIEVMRGLEDNSVDSIVTDPPYGIGFMSKDWDCEVPGNEFAAEAFRVLKPGGHLIAFAACRTVHRLMVNVEDAGFEIRDLISWLQWQGFPKSHDVSKAIDNAAGVERRITGTTTVCGSFKQSYQVNQGYRPENHSGGYRGEREGALRRDEPESPEAKRWSGWGTALKPSQEPAVLARKPLEGTVAENVLKWGTGGLNIDGCRIPYGDMSWPGPGKDAEALTKQAFSVNSNANTGNRGGFATSGMSGGANPFSTLGRWPANIYHCPKPSRSEREKGCEELPTKTGAQAVNRKAGSKGMENPRAGAGRTAEEVKNIHPTVKPTNLMRWLVRLVTPKDGVILEPFCGSGTTLLAAELEGFNCTAIEREPKYCDIIRARFGGMNG